MCTEKKYSDSHVENIERFGIIITICNGFGTVYNPLNEKLSVANMTLQKEEARQLHDDYIVADAATELPINERQDMIEELVKRMRSVKNLVLCTNAEKSFKMDVKTLVDKFTGDKVRKKKPKEGEVVKKRKSNSHLGVVKRIETFGLLLSLLRNEPTYAPNEDFLKITALDDAAARLESLSGTVEGLKIAASLKRLERDRSLYLEDDGLVDVSLKCKKYVRAVYGARSEEAKLVSKIKLKRFMRVKK